MFQKIVLPELLSERGYQLTVYRGDLEHQGAPGNKWHKLKYNLAEAKAKGAKAMASFGGPFSNHVHALGNICAAKKMQAVAVIRGELQPNLTPTLVDFVNQGGMLWPSSRYDYRQGMASSVKAEIDHYIEGCYWIPEGGANALGAKGCFDWSCTIYNAGGAEFSHWVMSAGTGTTCAGFLANNLIEKLTVIPAIKGGKGLREDILFHAHNVNADLSIDKNDSRLLIDDRYHFGGYARMTVELKDFLTVFSILNPDVEFDPVYTAKVLFGVINEMTLGRWPLEKTLLIHTGGLQGRRGYPSLN